MATVPLSGTNIRLLSGVPFQSDYKNTRWFDTVTDQLNYFSSKPIVHSMSEYTFQRVEGKTFIRVNKSIDYLRKTNYLMFQNTSYNAKWFYAFVTHLEYINAGLTHVHFQLDVFQTWRFDYTFKPSFVVREHCKLWESDGSPVINTVDEGLNYGTEYEVVDVANWKPYNDIFFLVIVSKSLIHDRDKEKAGDIYPNVNTIPQPLCYYVHPFRLNNTVPNAWDENDENIVLSPTTEILQAMYLMDDAVNNIVSLYVTDYIGFDISVDGSGTMRFPTSNFTNVNKAYNPPGDTSTTKYFNTLFVNNLTSYTGKSVVFANKYSNYRSVKESKLLMYPYTVLTLDDLKGNRQVIKNEYINDTDITVTVHGSLGTSNKVSYGLENYLVKDNLEPADWFYSSLEHSLINTNPNDVPIITDMLAAFLQGNRNSIQNQLNSTIFNGFLDTMGGLVNAGTSVAAGAVTGNGMGATSGAVGGTIQAVKGMSNTYFTTQGMIAKQQDINNTPPSLAKMGSNTYFDYGNRINGLYLIKKQIRPEYQKKLEDFFNVFGYKKNEVKIPNFHTRRYWNYVHTAGCTVTGDFNNEDLNELKAIFDNGITFWHTDDIGNYSLDNGVI